MYESACKASDANGNTDGAKLDRKEISAIFFLETQCTGFQSGSSLRIISNPAGLSDRIISNPTGLSLRIISNPTG